MESMFNGCDALTSLDLNGWNVSKVTSHNNMFKGCTHPDLKIYVSTQAIADWVKATPNFPTTATVIIGSPT